LPKNHARIAHHQQSKHWLSLIAGNEREQPKAKKKKKNFFRSISALPRPASLECHAPRAKIGSVTIPSQKKLYNNLHPFFFFFIHTSVLTQ
jgi:hypothetical protein